MRSRQEYHASLPGSWPLSVSLASTTKRLTFHSSLDFSLGRPQPSFSSFGGLSRFLFSSHESQESSHHACHSAPAAGNDIAIMRMCLLRKLDLRKFFITGTTPEITKF